LFSIIKIGSLNLLKLPKGASESVHFSLRIINAVLAIQKPFLESVAPALVEIGYAVPSKLPNSMACLEELISSDPETLIHISSFGLCEQDRICIEALKVLKTISFSPTFSSTCATAFSRTNRLVGVLSQSSFSNQIIEGFVQRIEVDTNENLSVINTTHEVQLLILDLLISNVQGIPAPNIAHFLLGLSTAKSLDEPDKKLNFCLKSVVTLLSRKNFYLTHPILAEKCYRLVFLLSNDPDSCSETLHHLRSQNFFCRELETFQIRYEESNGPANTFTESDIARVYQGAWLLKTVAIELHVSMILGQRSQSDKIIDLLFRSGPNDFNPELEFEQNMTKAVDMINRMSTTFSPTPDIGIENTCYNQILLKNFVKTDSRGASLYDIRNFHIALLSCLQSFQQEGLFMAQGSRKDGEESLMDRLTAIARDANRHQELNNARFLSVQAWCHLIRDSLVGYFDLLEHNRESLIFILLSSILPHANSMTRPTGIGGCISETTLALISRLEQDRKYNTMLKPLMIGLNQTMSLFKTDLNITLF
jgi:nuclear pore complex protein Nup205